MLWELSYLMLLSFVLVDAVDFTGKKLEGNVVLPDEITEISKGSWLKIELQDARKADTSSKTLAKSVMDDKQLKYVKGQPIAYSIDLNGELDEHAEYTLSAVLNVGWSPKAGGDWIRKGDLLTDTNFPVTLASCSKPEQKVCKAESDLNLVKYN